MPHAIASNADGQSATLVGIVGTGFGWDFNGTTWDRHRNRQEVTAYASAARTTAQTGSDIPTYNLNGATIVLDVTAITATPVLTLTIQGKDSLSGKYYDSGFDRQHERLQDRARGDGRRQRRRLAAASRHHQGKHRRGRRGQRDLQCWREPEPIEGRVVC
jgi:hypothetical protein